MDSLRAQLPVQVAYTRYFLSLSQMAKQHVLVVLPSSFLFLTGGSRPKGEGEWGKKEGGRTRSRDINIMATKSEGSVSSI